MSPNTVVVVGSLVVDLAARVERRPRPGETVTATEFGVFLGGKGFNQAVAAARSGAPARLIGKLGNDPFADWFAAALDREGIDRSGILVCDEGTGIATPLIDAEGQNTIVVAPRANLALSAEDVAAQAAAIRGASVVLLQLETTVEAVRAAAHIAREAGVPVILNPAPAMPVTDDLLANCSILTPNENEAEALTGIAVDGDEAAWRAAESLSRCGPGTVIVTLGSRGVAVLHHGERRRLAAFPVQAIDSTGAGDAFNGALAARLAAGDSLWDAVRYANAAGALTVTALGAEPSLPRADAIWTLLAANSR